MDEMCNPAISTINCLYYKPGVPYTEKNYQKVNSKLLMRNANSFMEHFKKKLTKYYHKTGGMNLANYKPYSLNHEINKNKVENQNKVIV